MTRFILIFYTSYDEADDTIMIQQVHASSEYNAQAFIIDTFSIGEDLILATIEAPVIWEHHMFIVELDNRTYELTQNFELIFVTQSQIDNATRMVVYL